MNDLIEAERYLNAELMARRMTRAEHIDNSLWYWAIQYLLGPDSEVSQEIAKQNFETFLSRIPKEAL